MYFDLNKQFSRQGFQVRSDAIVANIRYSKVIQFQERLLQVPLLPVADEDIRPVSWVRRMLQVVKAEAQDAMFCVPVAGHDLPIAYEIRTMDQAVAVRLY